MIRFLVNYDIYLINNMVTLDAGVESALVSAKIASNDLTGGIGYIPLIISDDDSQIAYFNKDEKGNIIGLVDKSSLRQHPIAGYSEVYNFNPANYRKSSAAFAKVRAGIANAVVAVFGDSTTVGTGALSPSSTTNCRPQSSPVRLMQMLNSTSLPVKDNSFMGDYNLGTYATLNAYDSRVTSATAAIWFGAQAFCGAGIRLNAATNAVTFTASSNCDTWDIYYHANSGQFSWTGSGGGTGNITGSGLGIQKTTVTVTSGTSLTIANISGTIYISGAKGYLSTVKEVSLINAGFISAVSSGFVDIFTGTNATFSAVAPELSIINIGINDISSLIPIDVFKANIQALITKAKTTGDVILVTPLPAQTTISNSILLQQSFVSTLYSLAVQNDIALVDLWNRRGSYAVSNPLGYYSDTVHQTAFGYADIAKAMYAALREF